MAVAVGAYSDYGHLALGWVPESRLDRKFKLIVSIVLVLMLSMGFILSMIDVPEEARKAQPVVSERIAQFIIEKEKIKVEQPKPVSKQEVKKILKKKKKPEQPVTKEQKKARNVAEKSGVLALSEQLSDLMDTSEVSSMIGVSLSRSSSTDTGAASFDRNLLYANTGEGSGGISSDKYTSVISSTELADYQTVKVEQKLVSRSSQGSSRQQGNIRTREDIAVVFDQNKSGLYSSYNRARRKSPGLKGKIVLEITIAPNGKVSSIKIISSELNNATLEKRLVARIKSFDFGAKKVKTITVTYPIEFLPS